MQHPRIIQGGMGIAVSNWILARTVSQTGELGVVSGTAMSSVLVRRLQDGDPGGHMRRALAHFPAPEIANEILNNYFIEGGRKAGTSYKLAPLPALPASLAVDRLNVVSCFAEVFLAKEGHEGKVGMNLLTKIQLPNLASLYGAMLAGVDYVIMGAGIPREIPGILDRFANHDEATMRIDVDDAPGSVDFRACFDPKRVIPLENAAPLKRPFFLAIVSSATLAMNLAKKATGFVDGFIVENKTAGGHNAPPRGALQLNDKGEPIYGPKDDADLAAMRALGRPFWLAGSYATPNLLRDAITDGAVGVQVGTAFAFSSESGLDPAMRSSVLRSIGAGQAPEIFTDPVASPSGFPFKVARVDGTISEAETYAARPRKCDLGYLRTPHLKADGNVGYRCQSEPVDMYLKKGGKIEDTVGRKCLCNGLMSVIGKAQVQKDGYEEAPIITAGDDLMHLGRLTKGEPYSAKFVIEFLRLGIPAAYDIHDPSTHTQLPEASA